MTSEAMVREGRLQRARDLLLRIVGDSYGELDVLNVVAALEAERDRARHRIAAEARQHGDGGREATAREIVREDFRSRGFSEADIATYLEGSGGLPYHPADAMLRVAEKALALAFLALPDTTGRERIENAGYVRAFYELAAMMGLNARAASPREVWEGEMKPRLRAALEGADHG